MWCCCDKKTCHLVVVSLMLIFCVVALILEIVELVGMPAIPSGWYIAGVVVCVIGILICCLDIYGIQKKNICCMVPFLVWMILNIILMAILAVVCIIFLVQLKRQPGLIKYLSEIYNIYGAVIGISVSFFILFAYFCYVISSHIKEVRAQEVLPVRQGDVRMQPRRENTAVKY